MGSSTNIKKSYILLHVHQVYIKDYMMSDDDVLLFVNFLIIFNKRVYVSFWYIRSKIQISFDNCWLQNTFAVVLGVSNTNMILHVMLLRFAAIDGIDCLLTLWLITTHLQDKLTHSCVIIVYGCDKRKIEDLIQFVF